MFARSELAWVLQDHVALARVTDHPTCHGKINRSVLAEGAPDPLWCVKPVGSPIAFQYFSADVHSQSGQHAFLRDFFAHRGLV
jgi:hypothetical protein